MSHQYIEMCGVNTHNLKNISVNIPKQKFVVISGVSGSGKSSLVMDTLFSHSKSIYLEALSNSMMASGTMDYQVDSIHGAQPPVALGQMRNRFKNPRSTVGTISGIDGYLRILFSKATNPVCPVCFQATDSELFCHECGIFADPLNPTSFSFNHNDGMCMACSGMGKEMSFSQEMIVPDKSKSLIWIWDNAVKGTFSIPNVRQAFEKVCKLEGIPLDCPFADLTEEQVDIVFNGSEHDVHIQLGKVANLVKFEGIIGYMSRQYKNTSSASRQKALEHYIGETTCPDCKGGRLRKESQAVKLNGWTYQDAQSSTIFQLNEFLDSLKLSAAKNEILRDTIRGLKTRTQTICKVGMDYLSLGRISSTLSGGELQRILLAQHIGSDLSGVMYIFDEPTVGLHERDSGSLIEILKNLRDAGNSVIVIEHNETVIKQADWIVEIGPGAGKKGGCVTATGKVSDIIDNSDSITGRYLETRERIRQVLECETTKKISFSGIKKHNLENVSVSIPLQRLVAVTGVSGAGKSTLVSELKQLFESDLKGNGFDRVVYVEQKPIGRSKRSNTATYLGIAKKIRNLFASQDAAIERGFGKSFFSANVAGGRCESCKGQGYVEIDMYFMKNALAVCDDCKGRRFSEDILAVTVDGKSINDVFEMSVEEAMDMFDEKEHPNVFRVLSLLNTFGLSYITLGQPTSTLSGGEAQRLNLAVELMRKTQNHALYIFDEPTTGLHFDDIRHLMRSFEDLINAGNSVLLVEHDMDVISQCDYVVDVGPEGGKSGGRILYQGPPNGLVNEKDSHTGRFLQKHLDRYSVTL
jgi:excinuclease ABC subunit A